MSVETCGNPACQNSTDLKKCALCKEVAYCCKSCQEAAWKLGHKSECFGKKLPTILIAIEIALFGVDGGGSDLERLVRIESQLQEEKGSNVVKQDTPDGIRSRLDNLLSASYISPIVAITSQSGVQYAVFSPFCYHGCFSTLDKATTKLRQVFDALNQEQGPVFSPAGYYCRAVMSGDLPSLNWYEHSMIAIYLSHYNGVRGASDTLIPPYVSGAKLTIPRNEMPSGLFMINTNDPPCRVFKTN